jgi:hypothetical protein
VAAREIRDSSGFLGVAQEADVVARVVPGGFGGLFQQFGLADQLVIYLKDRTRSDSARTMLKRLLSCGAAYPGWDNRLVSSELIQDRDGLFTASQLLAFLHDMEQLRNDPAIWAMEIDPETNRVWIGLKSANDLVRVRAAVASAAVPSEAVEIEMPPPVTGTEPFRVLDSVIIPRAHATDNGVFLAGARVQYMNRYSETRYPDNCVTIGGEAFSFFYHVEKWDGLTWKKVHDPDCLAIALPPRPVLPGESMTDSVRFIGVRRVRSSPLWLTARITGTYRFVGKMYLSTTPNAPFLANLAPEVQNSTPFRIYNTLPF